MVGQILKKSGRSFKFLRWLGLFIILWGLTACSVTPKPPPIAELSPDSLSGAPAKKTSASEPRRKNYVGLKIPPMPKGHETELGYLLEPEGQGKYSIEVVNFGSKKVVWLGRFLYHDKRGKAHWKIIAELPPQPLPEGYHFSGGNCLRHGRPQPEIVAIFKMEDKKTFTRIHKAWRAEPQNNQFKELPLKGIHCINEGWSRL